MYFTRLALHSHWVDRCYGDVWEDVVLMALMCHSILLLLVFNAIVLLQALCDSLSP